MMRETAAVDVDDVLAATTEALRLHVNELTGNQLTPEHYMAPGAYWGYYESVWATAGITENEYVAKFNDAMSMSQEHIFPIAGSTIAVPNIAKKIDLVAVTSRPEALETETARWLKHYYGDVFKKLVFLDHAGVAKQTKGEVCVELGAKWLVEDNIDHCLTTVGLPVAPVLFGEYGWQQDVPSDLIRCKNWLELEEYFNGFRQAA